MIYIKPGAEALKESQFAAWLHRRTERSCHHHQRRHKETHMNRQAEQTIARIARDILRIDTLESRKSDSQDFHDLAVWTIKEALEAAYRAGEVAAQRP
jgi:hypothetical protein